MKPIVEPYLFFGGRCAEALEYYREHLGAEIGMIMRYRESPDISGCPSSMPAGWGEKVMHASFTIGASRLMGSDGMKEGMPADGHCMSLTLPDEGQAKQVFAALADGGHVFMPLDRTFWSPCFGMVTDRFGIHWMITIPGHI